jgi:pescadillo protein
MRKKIYKGKSTKGDKGREAVKGSKGIAAQYTTRNRAIKKLQINLKDFRRLCILKGIFPRDPKKKKYGKDKTYYHIKDIQFLAHEPLLNKFRELKIFLRKHKKAMIKRNYSKAQVLEENKPVLKLDHLIKERYPSFDIALRDLDDSLNMLFLFRTIPVGVNKYHTQDTIDYCYRLTNEYLNYLIQSQSLYKVFISIKGIYLQAIIESQYITTLIPHSFTQYIPTDVDYRIMLTFLQFYQTLQKFVNFKLYHEMGFIYPPKIDQGNVAITQQVITSKINNKQNDNNSNNTTHSTSKAQPGIKSVNSSAQLQASVDSVLSDLTRSKAKQRAAAEDLKSLQQHKKNEEDNAMSDGEEEEEEELKQFNDHINSSSEANLTPEQQERERIRVLFKGLTFFVSREVPQEISEVIIKAAGGDCVLEKDLYNDNSISISSIQFSHHLIDRPVLAKKQANIIYIQPQWIFDCFNARILLPVEDYAAGKAAPPHLSPFVNDEELGYIPKQRLKLNQLGAINSNNHANNVNKLLIQAAEEKDEEETKEENEGGEAGSSSEEELSEELSDSEAEELQFVEELAKESAAKAPASKLSTAKKPIILSSDKSVDSSAADLARAVMSKKNKRLLSKIEYSQQQKANQAENLNKKRKLAEKSNK